MLNACSECARQLYRYISARASLGPHCSNPLPHSELVSPAWQKHKASLQMCLLFIKLYCTTNYNLVSPELRRGGQDTPGRRKRKSADRSELTSKRARTLSGTHQNLSKNVILPRLSHHGSNSDTTQRCNDTYCRTLVSQCSSRSIGP